MKRSPISRYTRLQSRKPIAKQSAARSRQNGTRKAVRATGNKMPAGRWDEAMTAAGWRCQMSSTSFPTAIRCSGALVVHHRLPRGMGGTSDPSIHDLDNLLVLCGGVTGRDGHHGEVEDNRALAYEHGLLVRHA